MSKKKARPYDVPALTAELVKISTMANANYSTTIDGARVEAAELVVKHSVDEKAITAARDVLVAISTDGAVLVHHRVRAIQALLEGQTVIQTIDAVREKESES